jgi:hypothetical protein
MLLLAKLRQKAKLEIKNSKKRVNFGGFQSPKVRVKQVLNCQIHTISFPLCSQKYRRMNKDGYFISGLQPNLAKSS